MNFFHSKGSPIIALRLNKVVTKFYAIRDFFFSNFDTDEIVFLDEESTISFSPEVGLTVKDDTFPCTPEQMRARITGCKNRIFSRSLKCKLREHIGLSEDDWKELVLKFYLEEEFVFTKEGIEIKTFKPRCHYIVTRNDIVKKFHFATIYKKPKRVTV